MSDEDTEGKTLPSGHGLAEIQRIQDERIAKWQANTLPVKLPASLQAAKDAAKPRTCGDCANLKEWRPKSPSWGKCHALSAYKLPMWIATSKFPDRHKKAPAEDCECFTIRCQPRKDPP